MSDIPNIASAMYPTLRSEADAAPEARPEAGSEPASLAEAIYGAGEPKDGLATARKGIEAGVARPAAEIAASEAAGQAEPGAFGLPAGALNDQFSAIVKETGLSEASASKMADLHRKALTETSTQYWEKTGSDWARATRSRFGGAELNSMVGAVQPLLADRGLTTPGFVKLLNEYRLGNNPDVVRTLANWARRMGRR